MDTSTVDSRADTLGRRVVPRHFRSLEEKLRILADARSSGGSVAAKGPGHSMKMLWSHSLDVHRAPASLTKLLTALVLLDTHWSADTVVNVSHEAAHINRSRVGFHAGDTVRAQDALTAMLMYSANDACMTLVQSVSPSLQTFAQRMNERAAALGMHDSHLPEHTAICWPQWAASDRRLAPAVRCSVVSRAAAAWPSHPCNWE